LTNSFYSGKAPARLSVALVCCSTADILAESVTFDTETKRPLSKEDLNKIDWNGKNAGIPKDAKNVGQATENEQKIEWSRSN
jgi:hypothetical protein